MAYIDRDYYSRLYGEIDEADFSRFSWEASRLLDVMTTGVDGVRKLKVAFPADEDDAETVRRCVGKLVQVLQVVDKADTAAAQSFGYTQTENGLTGNIIASVSAGGESISYATGGASGTQTAIGQAISDKAARDTLLRDTVRDYLSGVPDANGVNLLYMGRYPLHVDKT